MANYSRGGDGDWPSRLSSAQGPRLPSRRLSSRRPAPTWPAFREPCRRWGEAGVGAVIRRCSMSVLCISGRDTKIDAAKHALDGPPPAPAERGRGESGWPSGPRWPSSPLVAGHPCPPWPAWPPSRPWLAALEDWPCARRTKRLWRASHRQEPNDAFFFHDSLTKMRATAFLAWCPV
jgi:hypothetical protein